MGAAVTPPPSLIESKKDVSIDAARTPVPSFGIATECGWGRGDPARLDGLLESHKRAVEYLTNSLSTRGVS